MPLGKRIRYYREKVKWTLEKLSERSDVEPGTISALENRDSARSQYAVAVAGAFGLTVNQLLDERTDYEVPLPAPPANDSSATRMEAREQMPLWKPLTGDEQLLLDGFRSAGRETKRGMLALAKSVLA